MMQMRIPLFFSLCVSLGLLISPLPLAAMAEDIFASMSERDSDIVMRHKNESYIYLGKELSDIAQVISDISSFDNHVYSPLSQLKQHIDNGYLVAEYTAVIEAIQYMHNIVYENYNKINGNKLKKFITNFDVLTNQINSGELTVNAQQLVSAKEKHDTDNRIASLAKGTRNPPYTMRVQGILSVNDEVVQNITAVNLSATDAIIQNSTVTLLSATDAVIPNVTVTTVSAADGVITNLSSTSFSATDEIVTNSTITNLSANDAVISTTLQFLDSTVDHIGIQAPTTVPTSYTVTLPSTVPTVNQVLRAGPTTATNLIWITEGGSQAPAASETVYVAKYGNDTTGNGSFDTPYLTLAKAIEAANLIASATNPVAILMSSGVYTEDNSVGPLEITIAGISIVGASASSVIIKPNTPANNLLLVDNTVRIADVTFQSSSPLAIGVSLAAGNVSVFNNVRFINFLTGVNCAGGAGQYYGFNTCLFVSNVTGLAINDTRVECNTCTFFGTTVLTGPAANTGISVTGAAASLVTMGGVIGLCATGMNITGNALTTASSIGFRRNAFDIVQSGASQLTLSGCTIELTDSSSDIDVQISGAGTTAEIIGCEFSGTSALGVNQASSIVVSNDGTANITGGVMHGYTTGLTAGLSSDSSATIVNVSGMIIQNCTTDIVQQGSATLFFNAGTSESSAITINDPTNVQLAFFDLNDNGALTIGSTANKDTVLVQADIAPANHPGIDYKSSLYSAQAVGFNNSFGSASSLYSLAANNSDLVAVTTDRTKIAGLRLVSDTGSPVGGTSALRGWDINKNASTAELSFQFQNSDTTGESAVTEYTVMQLDGFNNLLQLPTAGTKIVFDADTNLYRSASGVLKTDTNLIVGGLTPGFAVITDPSTNELESSVTSSTELSYVHGVTSAIQTQINGKVSKSGDTMTGTLTLPAGTAAAPSLQFTGSTNTGLSAATANVLSFDISGSEVMNIGASGVTIDAFTTAGVVHNNSSGLLSSSLIVNADITNATIANAKLATISSSDIPGYIVVRDGSGNFATNMITLDGTTTNPTDAATKAYVDAAVSAGIVPHTPALVISTTDIGSPPAGLQTIDGVTLVANNRVLLNGQTNQVENGLWLAQSGNWTRPTDFSNGSEAGAAYVLILEGTTYAGSSWLCNTPTAVIGTDPITFVEFTSPSATTGNNVGAGSGQVYQSKTGVTLNFRTLLADAHLTITTNTDTVEFATDATSSNTASTIVARDSSGNFSAGTITASLTGAASANVLKAGDTMTGSLTMPAGTIASPSIKFTGSNSGTGITAQTADVLSFDIAGSEIMNIGASGVTVDAFTTAGVVHNSSAGLLSSSLIVNADISATAAITDNKLATISTAGKVANSATTATSSNSPNTIVLRDSSGNFAAGTITASLTGAASANVLKAGDTMTGTLQLPAGSTSSPSLVFTGSTLTGLSANTDILSFSNAGSESMKIDAAGVVTIDMFTTAGVVHNDASGNLSSSLIVNADVSATAAIIDSKLATIVSAGKVANSATTATSANTPSTIVLRDTNGNFSANAVSFNDAVIGTLTLTNPIASVTITDLSVVDASISDMLSVNDEVINGTLQISSFTPAGVLHNDASGNITSSLIVNADITNATITNAKLAAISSSNIANDIVVRDGTGSFAAQEISMNDGILAGNLILSTEPSTSTAGNIIKGSSRFIHDFGTNNTFVGINAGNFTMSGSGGNSALGKSALTANTTGAFNTAVGFSALAANTNGVDNTALGYNALAVSTTGTDNTAVGYSALAANATGTSGNTAVGSSALAANTTGTFNAAVGYQALTANTIGVDNSAFGYGALIANITGTDNTALGYNTLPAVTTGSTNIAIGSGAGSTLTTGSGNIYINANAGSAAEATTTRIGTSQTQFFAAGINGVTPSGSNSAVTINSSGQLGTGSITNSVITNGTITNFSSTDAYIEFLSVVDETITGTASINDAIITNATIATLSITNCLASLCVNNLSVVNESLSGTLSVNNEIVSNITATNLSSTDAYIEFLSVVDETITGTSSINDAIITNETVTTLSVSNEIATSITATNETVTTLSVTNEIMSGNLTLTTEPSTSSAGNIIKGSSRFIHDFGTNNTFVGINAGNFTMSGSGGNSALGKTALTANTTGAFNTAVGYSTLAANTIGVDNTAIGYGALAVSTTGTDNTAVGYNALTANATGTSGNTAMGSSALAANTTGTFNAAVGYQALTANTIGVDNSAFGYGALIANITGTDNTALGYNTLPAVTTGSTNIAIGSGAGGTLTTGAGNIYINANAGSASEATTTRIGTSQTQFFAAGINGVTPSGSNSAVTINSSGQLGTGAITNLVVTNGTITNLSSTDAYIEFLSVVDETITGTSSITDAIITNATIANLSITNCLASLCVNNLSVVNESLSGTLSVNNEIVSNITATSLSVTSEIVTNSTITNLSSTDAYIEFLSVVDETITGTSSINDAIITNETVTTLSVSNEIATSITATNETVTTLSVTNEVISGNLTLTTEPSTSSAGNIIKGSSRFIHDFGTNNTFVGINAGNFTMSGSGGNSALGKSALTANTTGAFNTAVGYNTLTANTIGVDNTAIGYGALAVSTTGTDNTAVGYNALAANTTGTSGNTAIGSSALAANTTGTFNAALGYHALTLNTVGVDNTAIGYGALAAAVTDTDNTAVGYKALAVNAGASFSTAIGSSALTANTTGSENTALGYDALVANVTGSTNIAIGYQAGQSLVTGSGNIYINADAGTSSESSTIRIGTGQTSCFVAGINGAGVSGDGVVVDSVTGQLGITMSSRRFKHDIEDMGSLSANILKLRPVTFIYNNDASEAMQYGLIAEEVDQYFPEIVAKDEHGEPYTVRYHLLPVLLLNELQKQQATIEEMKQQYVTIEEMNNVINNLKKQIKNFIKQSKGNSIPSFLS